MRDQPPKVLAEAGGTIEETRVTFAVHGADLDPDEMRWGSRSRSPCIRRLAKNRSLPRLRRRGQLLDLGMVSWRMLCPTPESKLCDARGRPYFLWDCDVKLVELREHLAAPDDARRTYWLAKLMRQAKPDDAIAIGGTSEMRRLWPLLEHSLGRMRAFWAWYLDWTHAEPA